MAKYIYYLLLELTNTNTNAWWFHIFSSISIVYKYSLEVIEATIRDGSSYCMYWLESAVFRTSTSSLLASRYNFLNTPIIDNFSKRLFSMN